MLFAKDGENALKVARLVERRFREHPNSKVTQEEVKAGETAGDVITRELIVLLNTQYLTPFDREDIYLLATEIDDVVDYLEEASDLLGLYGIEMPARRAVEQCAVIVKAVEQLAIACSNLKGMKGVQDIASVDPHRLDPSFAGRTFDHEFSSRELATQRRSLRRKRRVPHLRPHRTDIRQPSPLLNRRGSSSARE